MTKKQYDRLVKVDKELMKLYHESRNEEYAVDLLLLACDVGKIHWNNYAKEAFKLK